LWTFLAISLDNYETSLINLTGFNLFPYNLDVSILFVLILLNNFLGGIGDSKFIFIAWYCKLIQHFSMSCSLFLNVVVSTAYLFLLALIYSIIDFCGLQVLIILAFFCCNGLLGGVDSMGLHNLYLDWFNFNKLSPANLFELILYILEFYFLSEFIYGTLDELNFLVFLLLFGLLVIF